MKEEVVFSVQPNPFSASLTISIEKQNIKHVSLIIRNVLGAIVLSESESNFNGECSIPVDLNFLSKGIYFLEIVADGERANRKIVKE